MDRLDKFISNATSYSRSEVKVFLKKGFVSVNGLIVKSGETKVSEADEIILNGALVGARRPLYYMLNKPSDVVSATEDNEHKTVVDLFPESVKKNIFPVGRLDIDTEGLLILTDDGELAHRLTSPKKSLFKKYFARATGELIPNYEDMFKQGISFKEFTSKPAKITVISEHKPYTEVYVEISEGKFHQVKRMLHAVGLEVVYLKRVSIGSLDLDEALALGEFRELTSEELEYLKSI